MIWSTTKASVGDVAISYRGASSALMGCWWKALLNLEISVLDLRFVTKIDAESLESSSIFTDDMSS
jgi:hypothetical protein